MSKPKKKKAVLTIKPTTQKIRKVWGIKPISRVQGDSRRVRLENLRRQDPQDERDDDKSN